MASRFQCSLQLWCCYVGALRWVQIHFGRVPWVQVWSVSQYPPCQFLDPLLLHPLIPIFHGGGSVRSLGRVSHAGAAFTVSVDPGSWEWKDVVTCTWKLQDDHINVLESRAYCLAVRWRLRCWCNTGSGIFHLVDSLASLSVTANGRSSSHRLTKAIARTKAHILAGHLCSTLGCVRSP